MVREILADLVVTDVIHINSTARLANGGALVARNAANDADISLITLDGADEIIVGSASTTGFVITPGGMNIVVGTGTGTANVLADELLLQGGSHNAWLSFYDITNAKKLSILAPVLTADTHWLLPDGNGLLYQSLMTDGGEPASLTWAWPKILAQSGLVGSPANGDIQINTDTGKLNYYSNYATGWVEVGPTNIGPQWMKFSKTFTDLTAAATTNDIELFSLPGSAVIHGVVIHHSTAFSGGTVSALTVSVGLTGNLIKYTSAWDVFQASGDTVIQVSSDLSLEDMTAATSIRLSAIATGDNLDQLTQGQVEVWLLVSSLSVV